MNRTACFTLLIVADSITYYKIHLPKLTLSFVVYIDRKAVYEQLKWYAYLFQRITVCLTIY